MRRVKLTTQPISDPARDEPVAMPTRDADLRAATRAALAESWTGVEIIDELPIFRGRARVDLALLSPGGLHGFELKSDVDSLNRLATQAPLFSRVFETMTLVCVSRHLAQVTRRVPSWWGIWIVDRSLGMPKVVRAANANPCPDPAAWAGLLWRSEMLDVLAAMGLDPVAPRATRTTLIEQLADVLAPDDLRRVVRHAMLDRRVGEI